ncbi:unnamed protein product [Ambrosiozyma monospora]|uniref:Unnamed protein product n=1 Tax=Ambrosiozyma monospora TaxID=43982 RepID=A0ACB5SRC9_AMBMO|nr:unnamed protein product [Ambrosiozyma monospora]
MSLEACLYHFDVEYSNEFNLELHDAVVVKGLDYLSFSDWRKSHIRDYSFAPTLEKCCQDFFKMKLLLIRRFGSIINHVLTKKKSMFQDFYFPVKFVEVKGFGLTLNLW